ncbi:DUF6155 family protein [Saccharibacillus sp. CPCC 101409]|uniref:DUF6155 family protein n=1 Tax=Saccharibacillus sp. CPCC 101409 TaxID=3058041 RepID=UPI002671168A|nr:DUF6155 family protein [Saccharibacillus sp. CPCC 101409]MDO3410931.1 DUF6155 family protein [Saccharibacillus sp. CPCC 101409]
MSAEDRSEQEKTKNAQKKVTIPAIKKTLKTYDKDALISMMLDCYRMSGDVKNYIHILMNPEETIEELYEKSKSLILQEFFPQRGIAKLKLSNAKKAISDFGKFSDDEVKILDLMIYYVELGVEFTNMYGDIDENFYSSIEKMYKNALKNIQSNQALSKQFNDRLKDIVDNARGIGWGFYDYLAGCYYEYMEEI